MNTGKAHRRKAQTRIGAVVKDHAQLNTALVKHKEEKHKVECLFH